jgi:protein TonB
MSIQENFAKSETRSGDFGECLVGGSEEEQKRRRKVKRRALAVSIVLQTLGLGVLVIAPMLAKPAELSTRTVPPMSIYSNRPSHPPTANNLPPRHPSGPCFKCAVNSKPQILPTDRDTASGTGDPGPVIPIPGAIESSGIPVADSRPEPPHMAEKTPPKRVVHTTIDPALLVHRVEPVFPPLARQIRRGGKVELHAIIATDGSIQSLEVASGDALFVQSALDAVRQWRYRPTYLNGQAVEIDTFITVIYSVQQQ